METIRRAIAPLIVAAQRAAAPQVARGAPPFGPYSRQYHAPEMPQFVASADFDIFKQEYTTLLDGIGDFVARHGGGAKPPLQAQAAADMAANLATLKRNLFDLKSDVFGKKKVLVYGNLHRKFRTLASLLSNPTIPLSKRLDVIHTIAPHLKERDPGVLNAVLEHANATLHYRYAGIWREAYKAKLHMINGFVSDHVESAHPGYKGNQNALLTTYFNHVAQAMGLPERKNPHAGAVAGDIDEAQIAQCREKVLAALHSEEDAVARAL
ncbi:MAG: hypothetical protein V4754_05720 [Pseudomonadota bacterium]